MELTIQKATALKEKPQDESNLGFGQIFTDHMFMMNYTEGKGWHDARIVPYGDFALDPAAMVLHYGQAIFEGMKAYRNPDGNIQLFRPMDNLRRFNRSAERLCIPAIDCDFVLDALRQLIRMEQDWVPHTAGTSLYIRPFAVATDAHLGVHVAHNYIFAIILSPVGAYYAEGLKPVRPLCKGRHGLCQGRRQLRMQPNCRSRSAEKGLRTGIVARWRRAQIH